MDLRRLHCVGPCACGGAFVVLMVLPLRFILASQAGLVIGWRTAAMPSNMLAAPAGLLRKAAAPKFSAPKRRTRDRILHRHINWKNRNAEGRMSSDPILHTLSNLMAKSFCLHATRLTSASRQALEELAPKLLQILLHAESSALLFYQEKRG